MGEHYDYWGGADAAAVPVPDAGDDTLRTIEKVISQRCTHPGFFWSGGSCRECRSTADALLPLIREHVAAAVQTERERVDRYQRLDLIRMKDELRMGRALDEALGIDKGDADACVPGCDEGVQGVEHTLHHLIERDAARGAAIQRARKLADVSDWHVYESQDTGDVYPAGLVQDLVADIRAALDGEATT